MVWKLIIECYLKWLFWYYSCLEVFESEIDFILGEVSKCFSVLMLIYFFRFYIM